MRASFYYLAPDCQMEPFNHIRDGKKIGTIEAIFFRFRIENVGRTAAENVEVIAYDIEDLKDGQSTNAIFTPLNLKWTYAESITMQYIPSQMTKLCDIGKIIRPNKREYVQNEDDRKKFNPSETVFSFEVLPKPNSLTHIILPGDYKLKLRIGASNCKPITKTITISFNGHWDNDEEIMLKNNVSIAV